MLVPVSVTVTVAPGTPAPCASVTVPTSVPFTACAQEALGAARMSTVRSTARTRTQYGVRLETLAGGWACAAREIMASSCHARSRRRAGGRPGAEDRGRSFRWELWG